MKNRSGLKVRLKIQPHLHRQLPCVSKIKGTEVKTSTITELSLYVSKLMSLTATLFWLTILASQLQSQSSIYPYFSEKNQYFEPALEGRWLNKENHITMEFQRKRKIGYVMISEYGKSSSLHDNDTLKTQVASARINDRTFLQLYGAEPKSKTWNNLREIQLLPVYNLLEMSLSGDALSLTLFTYGEHDKNRGEKPNVPISHFLADRFSLFRIVETVYFTAPTSELEKFIATLIDDKNAFDPKGTLILHRMK